MDEIRQRMRGTGPRTAQPVPGRNGGEFRTFGDYSIDLFEHARMSGNPPSRALFDLASVAIVKQPLWAVSERIPAPALVAGKWIDRPDNRRTIAIWHDFNRDAIVQDLFRIVRTPDARN
jgi:hypothetical protein